MEGDVFHILNRGVEKRKIFLNEKDYFRFVYGLRDFNDKNTTPLSYWNRRKYNNSAIRKPNKKSDRDNDELVDVLCWCLMPNHYHILVQEKIDGGSSVFSKKISSGYTQYFNLKNKRSGVLFQGKSKIILIERDEHFMYLPYYIFSNPIKLVERDWKEESIKNLEKVMEFLKNYKWSSYLDITEKNNFPFIINKKSFSNLFGLNGKQFQKNFIEWIFGYRIAE
ncbi:MAG: hypothetical protein ABH889_02290 [Candidatus Portnoybacteria bacterium]